MKHINLDKEPDRIKRFVRRLPVDPDGSILEINGEPIVKLLPVHDQPVDKAKLRAAVRRRREVSRELNREWEAADRELWACSATSEE